MNSKQKIHLNRSISIILKKKLIYLRKSQYVTKISIKSLFPNLFSFFMRTYLGFLLSFTTSVLLLQRINHACNTSLNKRYICDPSKVRALYQFQIKIGKKLFLQMCNCVNLLSLFQLLKLLTYQRKLNSFGNF